MRYLGLIALFPLSKRIVVGQNSFKIHIKVIIEKFFILFVNMIVFLLDIINDWVKMENITYKELASTNLEQWGKTMPHF